MLETLYSVSVDRFEEGIAVLFRVHNCELSHGGSLGTSSRHHNHPTSVMCLFLERFLDFINSIFLRHRPTIKQEALLWRSEDWTLSICLSFEGDQTWSLYHHLLTPRLHTRFFSVKLGAGLAFSWAWAEGRDD